MKIAIKKGKKHFYYEKRDTVKQLSTNTVITVDSVDSKNKKIISNKGELFDLTADIKPTDETFKTTMDRIKAKRTVKKIRGFELVSKKQFDIDFKDLNAKYEDIKLPKRGTKKSAGYDVFAPFDFTLQPNEDIKIPTAIKSYMEDGVTLKAYPRSGLGFNYYTRMANTVPIIDGDYYNNVKNEGHIFVKIRNEGNKILEIKKGEGICQFVFEYFLLADGDSFENGEIRNGGFGSTTKSN